MTVGEQIVEKVVAMLTAALASSPAIPVFNQRVRPFDLTELPAVNVKCGKELVTYEKRTAHLANRELEIYVRMEAPGDPPALDPIRDKVIKALMPPDPKAPGRIDRSVGGLALGISEVESEWEYEAGSDAVFGVLQTTYRIWYDTRADDATVQIGKLG
jgi:hypothetical protein